MNYLTKTREELIKLLEEQTQELDSIKALLNKESTLEKSITEKEIIENKNRLRVITESSLDAIILIDPHGHISFWNQAAERLFGYTHEEVIGLNMHELLAPSKYHEAYTKGFKSFSFTGDGPVINQILELEAIHKNGNEILIELSVSNIKIDDGWHALGFIRDITKKKQAEILLRESELKYRNLIENINDVIYEIDVNGNIIFISSPIERIIGFKPEEISGKNFQDFVGTNTEYLTHRLALLKNQPEITNEYKIKSKSGEDRWIRLSTKAIFSEDKITGAYGTLADITEKKQLYLELQKSEALYRSILHASPDTIFISDLNGKVLFTSPMANKMFGFENTEFPTNTSLFRFVDPRDHDKAREAIKHMYDGLYTGATEFLGVKSDGSTFDMEVNGEFIRDDKGNPVSMVFVARDVTERNLAEEKLKKSEETYRHLIETINDVIYEIALDGTVKYVSPSFKKMTGYLPEEIIGTSFFRIVHPEDMPKLLERLSSRNEADLAHFDLRFISKQNQVIWVRSLPSKIFENGKVAGRAGILTDITEQKIAEIELKKSEDSFRNMVENINDVVYEVSAEGIVKYVSPSIEKFLGYKPEELIGKNFFNYMHEDDRTLITKRLNSLDKKDYTFLEYRYYSKNKKIRWVRSSTNPTFEDGKMVGGRGVLIDITEQKKAEEKLRESESRYKMFFEGNNSIMLLIDPENGAIIDANPAASKFYGWSRADLCQMNISEINTLPIDEVNAKLKQAKESQQLYFNFKHLLSNGESRDVEIYASPVNFGKSNLLNEVIHDITERKHIEEKLKESEARFRMVFESVFDGISIFEENDDPFQRKLVDCNEQYALMSGRSRDELLKIGYIYSLTQPNFEENVNQKRLQGIREQSAYHGSFKWLRPDGKDNTIEYVARPIQFQGKLYSIGIDRDITEFKEKEDQLRKLSQAVEQSPVSIVITDIDGNIEYANPEACKTTGYSLPELMGSNPRVLKSGETSSNDYQELWDTISKGNYWKGIFHNKRKNGELYWESSQISPIVDNNGKIINYLAIKEDITEQKRIQEELKERETELNIAQKIANMGSWNMNLKTNKMSWSENYYQMLGLEGLQDNISSDYFFKILHPDDAHLIDDMLDEMLRTKQQVSYDIRILMPGNQVKWMQNNIVPIFEGNNLVMLKGVNIDITEKKLAEEKVIQQNERLTAIINAIPDLIFITDQHGTYLEYFKSHLSDMLIFPEEKLIGTNMKDIFDRETSALHLEKTQECLAKQQLITYEYSLLQKDTRFYFEARLVPLANHNVLRFVRDFTYKQLKNNELRNLSLAIEQSPVSIIITDLDANIQYINPSFITTSGYSAEEILGRNTSSLKSGLTEKEVYTDLWNTITKGLSWKGEWINKRKNGELYWESISITPIYDDLGTLINYLAVKQDISERKKAEKEIQDLNATLEKKIEERTNQLAEINVSLKKEIEERKVIAEALEIKTEELENFFNVTLDLLSIADTQGNFIRVNKAWENILGYSTSDLEKRQLFEFVHPDDLEITLKAIREMTEQHPILNFINRYKTKDGSYRFIEWRSSPSGKLIYSAARDITERKLAEEETQKARLDAEQANMAKSEFLSRMSHELRTPMNSILGFAQLLEMGELNASQRKGVNHIMKSGKHLLDLINEVLDISRIESGRLSLSLEPVQLNKLIAEMTDIVKLQAAERKIEILLVHSEDNKLFVKSDRQRLKQVILNLLNNATKYNRDGGSIFIRIEQQPDGMVRISVTDTGYGIAPESIPKLFTPFERIGAEKTSTEGTGLGLSVVKKLMEVMGGNYGVESFPDKGSTFWIEMPRSESQLEEASKLGNLEQKNTRIDGKAGTILYIEDNQSNIELVEQILNSQRTDIDLITDVHGKKAVPLAIEYKPDLILLDLNLPDIHGSIVLQQLQSIAETKYIPVVVISADAMPQQLKKLLDAGAKKYMTKPLDISEFLKLIQEYLPSQNFNVAPEE